jgi:hypothetical protein
VEPTTTFLTVKPVTSLAVELPMLREQRDVARTRASTINATSLNYVGERDATTGQPHGDGTLVFEDDHGGGRYTGQFYGGHPHGLGVYTLGDGTLMTDAVPRWSRLSVRSD